MDQSFCLLGLFSSLIVVSALPWSGPQETLLATTTANWSPAPTRGIYSHEVLRRYYYPANLCGWQGPYHVGAYCSTDSSCAWFTDISVVGCCSVGGSCDAVYTSCIDGNHPPQSTIDSGVFTCKSKDLCYKNTFDNGYYQYGCGSTSKGQAVVTSWGGINTEYSIAIIYTGGALGKAPDTSGIEDTAAAFTSSENSNKATSSAGPPSPSKPSLTTANPPALSAPVTSSSSSTASPTTISGAGLPATQTPTSVNGLSTSIKIVIGVLSGVVVILAIAFFMFFYRLRRRKHITSPAPDENPSHTLGEAISELEQPKDSKNVILADGHENYSRRLEMQETRPPVYEFPAQGAGPSFVVAELQGK